MVPRTIEHRDSLTDSVSAEHRLFSVSFLQFICFLLEMLCERCQNFDIQAFSRNAYPYRGYLLSAIGQSAREGCSFCNLLLHYAGISISSACDSSFLWRDWVHFSVVREANSTSTGFEDDGGLNISYLHVEFDFTDTELDLHVAADEGM